MKQGIQNEESLKRCETNLQPWLTGLLSNNRQKLIKLLRIVSEGLVVLEDLLLVQCRATITSSLMTSPGNKNPPRRISSNQTCRIGKTTFKMQGVSLDLIPVMETEEGVNGTDWWKNEKNFFNQVATLKKTPWLKKLSAKFRRVKHVTTKVLLLTEH